MLQVIPGQAPATSPHSPSPPPPPAPRPASSSSSEEGAADGKPFFKISVGDPWHFGADPDLRICRSDLWPMDPAPDPTPDPTPFFRDFKDKKMSYFFLKTYLQAHYLQS